MVRVLKHLASVSPDKVDYVWTRLIPVPALLTSYPSPSLGLALLLPAALPELLSALLEPPASKHPRVRRERRGDGALTKSAKDPHTPCASRPATIGRGYTAAGDGERG